MNRSTGITLSMKHGTVGSGKDADDTEFQEF